MYWAGEKIVGNTCFVDFPCPQTQNAPWMARKYT